ncbi:SOS response-associated peptidase [Acidiphilium sp. PA]|uniref:SOS response-associated peptidase n=1 Tax=Acidiphilium sp. PA TaxID=2871705 RepID=UPI0022448A85|nr:SOS response-associated peptidase [Acidiphilium sp. PA]MCW8308931.1 SOS response-associated peptidase [Acidiphilium sp. PA]
MCGRIAQSFPDGSLDRLIGIPGAKIPRALRWNVSPGQSVVAIHQGDGRKRQFCMPEWGFVAPWEKVAELARIKPINAKAETVAASKLFGSSFKSRRCLVPVRCWYEWKTIAPGVKQPYALGRTDAEPITLGGIISLRRPHRDFPVELSLAIITTPAPDSLADIHARAPLVIDQADWPVWLGEVSGDPSGILKRSTVGAVGAWPVSGAVNRATTDCPDLVEPVEIVASAMAAEGIA